MKKTSLSKLQNVTQKQQRDYTEHYSVITENAVLYKFLLQRACVNRIGLSIQKGAGVEQAMGLEGRDAP